MTIGNIFKSLRTALILSLHRSRITTLISVS